MEKPGQAQTNSAVNWRNGGRIATFRLLTSEVIIKGILQSLIENSLIKVTCVVTKFHCLL